MEADGCIICPHWADNFVHFVSVSHKAPHFFFGSGIQTETQLCRNIFEFFYCVIISNFYPRGTLLLCRAGKTCFFNKVLGFKVLFWVYLKLCIKMIGHKFA